MFLLSTFYSNPDHCYKIFFSPKAPVEQTVRHAKPRAGPTESTQRAGAAALARIEQQHKPRPQTSQDVIRNQGKLLFIFEQTLLQNI